MKPFNRPLVIAVTALGISAPQTLPAIEEAEYRVVSQHGDIEIREYASSLVAETIVSESFEGAGSRAFGKLFRYIDGNNEGQGKIAMTAPVSQQKTSEKIAMTAPVSQKKSGSDWAVSFMMPPTYSMDTIPRPLDPDVVIRTIDPYSAAVIRYSGTWSEKRYQQHLDELENWLNERGIPYSAEPVWARYDAPFKPWFLRRNEILLYLQ